MKEPAGFHQPQQQTLAQQPQLPLTHLSAHQLQVCVCAFFKAQKRKE